MSDFVVRQFEPTDADAVAALWEETLPSSQPWNEPRFVICRKRLHDDNLLFVGERLGQIIATAIAGYDGVRGWLYSVAVAPDHRRQGIGRRMLVAAENALLAKGCPKVNLQVRATNSQVIDFYRRCGYATEERASLGKPLHLDRDGTVDAVPTLRVDECLSLSQIKRSDIPAYCHHLNATREFHERMALMPFPYTDLDAEQWITKATGETVAEHGSRNWAIRDGDDKLIGGVGLVGITAGEKAELGYWLAKAYWGRGIMTAAVRRICTFAFDEYNLQRMHAQALSVNLGSVQVLRKAGFVCEGTLRGHHFLDGKSYDVELFGMLGP